MKTLAMALLVAGGSLLSSVAAAESWPEASIAALPPAQHTVAGNARITGWYIAPTSGFTSLGSNQALLTGLRAAVMIDDHFGVGLATNLMTNSYQRPTDGQVRNLSGYGGLYLQYVMSSDRAVHTYVDATIGAGGACAKSDQGSCHGRDFAMFEPTVNAEVDLGKNVRLAAGVGYRAAASEDGGLSSRDLSGLVVRTSLVLGSF